MPIYVYKCPVCGAVEEHNRKIAEMDHPVHCYATSHDPHPPPRMERIIAAPASNFPGAGTWRGGA